MRFMKNVVKALVAALLLATFTTPGGALTRDEARVVVEVLSAIGDELGGLAYDEEAADEWYEEDRAGAGYIVDAGFTRDAWRKAVDQTLKGFYASLPDDEIERSFAAMRAFELRDDLSDTQKQAMRDLIAKGAERLDRWRKEGAAHAELVRPHAGRLSAILSTIDE